MNSAPDAVFFAVICLATLASIWRELPLQYVATVAVIAVALGALACFFSKSTCWWLPLIVLNSRGVSRYSLRKWQPHPYYGWWVIALTCALSSLLAPHWSTPLLSFALQLAAMPWLIKRKPGRDAPRFDPLLIWLLLGLWLIVRPFLDFNWGIHL